MYHLNMATGKIHTEGFAAGGIGMSGKKEPLNLSGKERLVVTDTAWRTDLKLLL
jgi:hypothetical protein